MITLDQIKLAAEEASVEGITVAAEFVADTADTYGPQHNAQFRIFKKGGFSQGMTTYGMGGFDGMKIHDAMAPFTRDVRYDFTQLDPHIRFRIEQGTVEFDQEFVTKILKAVVRSLGGVYPEAPPVTPPSNGGTDGGTQTP
ncbi:hypothetical protein SP15_232 [Bacillus phage SP-15]|uniref:Uncharacterized protein n=1 Tax=Bacillus phage SP-15 TaxID=1792032 RepID=A0A127AWL4_9CAUD|nr:hypothetical protein SP15_232 [Bacillus phage SP-15]AMM45035.1 hypothetical protein SP15_232 [Bacillus phage SP-15]